MYDNPQWECRVLDCDRKLYVRGYCSRHYDKIRKEAKKCSFPRCPKNARKLGYCSKHSHKGPPLECKIPGCREYNFRRGLCDDHARKTAQCQLDDCGKQVYCKGLCKTHYNRQIWERKKKSNPSEQDDFNFYDLAQILR